MRAQHFLLHYQLSHDVSLYFLQNPMWHYHVRCEIIHIVQNLAKYFPNKRICKHTIKLYLWVIYGNAFLFQYLLKTYSLIFEPALLYYIYALCIYTVMFLIYLFTEDIFYVLKYFVLWHALIQIEYKDALLQR